MALNFNMNFGGDDNEYVDAAGRAASQSKGPSIIASVLDLLGIHKQAAKPPAEGSSEGDNSQGPGESKNVVYDAQGKKTFLPEITGPGKKSGVDGLLQGVETAANVAAESGLSATPFDLTFKPMTPMKTIDPDSVFKR